MSSEILYLSIFILFVVFVLALDLGLFSKRDKKMRLSEAVTWTLVWVGCALAFYIFLNQYGEKIHGITDNQSLRAVADKYAKSLNLVPNDYELSLELYRKNMSLEFLTAYLIEYALSVDNIFVFILVFSSFGVAERHYKRILFWGILGAIVMRCLFIFSGSALLQSFSWVFYIFGALLVFTGIKMFVSKEEDEKIDPNSHPIVKFLSKNFSVFPRYVSHHFFVKKAGKWMITPLFVVLLVIEFTDLIFAIDSVPAAFSITSDPYIIFFSNIFAIIGLRSLFFLITGVMHLFHYLKPGLAILLTFIGLKMILHHWLKEIGFTTTHSLIVVLAILSVSIGLSLFFPKEKQQN